jgi:hypothetical protein
MPYQPEAWQRNRRRRRCKLDSCKQLFLPKASNQDFCCQDHRRDYHMTHQGEKFKNMVIQLCREEIRRLIRPNALKKPRGA